MTISMMTMMTSIEVKTMMTTTIAMMMMMMVKMMTAIWITAWTTSQEEY